LEFEPSICIHRDISIKAERAGQLDPQMLAAQNVGVLID
jgi:hypothetical protein